MMNREVGWMKLHNSRRLWAVLVIFFLFACLSAFVVVRINDSQRASNLEHGRYLLESEANKFTIFHRFQAPQARDFGDDGN